MWPFRPDPETLCDECQAFLDGTYADYARALGWQVPPWAWLNFVAHVPPEELRAFARGGARRWRRPRADWTDEFDDLAKTIVALARTDEDIATLQRQALIPLELQHAAQPVAITPTQLARRARFELEVAARGFHSQA